MRMRFLSLALTAAWLAVVVVAAEQTPAGPAVDGRAGGGRIPTVVGRTPEVFTLRLARKTNHISNCASGIGATGLPPVDTTLATGDLGWQYHTGGHVLTVDEWKAFLALMDRYLKN
jgi:hypothetical protein